ncbi:hypothetical protein KAW96_01190 [candidate division WOR-3 bacterium]|nr:hypothetical protein [candidate division WOR-3 bacterium]
MIVSLLSSILLISCNQNPKKQEYKEWNGEEEFQKFLELSSIARELFYPGARGEMGAIVKNETHMYLFTKDKHKVVAKYYEKNLQENGWKIDINESDKGGTLLGFEKGKYELIIFAKVVENAETKIEITHRPF